MRTDIELNTVTHDLVMHDTGVPHVGTYAWLDGDYPLRGQILVPDVLDGETVRTSGVRVHIPDVPVHAPIQVQLLHGGRSAEWADLRIIRPGRDKKEVVYASELSAVDIGCNFLVYWDADGDAVITPGMQPDFGQTGANRQNSDLLLQCIPGNSYRYPISGVGLVKYLHSNSGQSSLGSRLQSEFSKEKVIVREASFDNDTGQLDLQLDFSQADGNI